jgi:hypothetical protein
MLCEQIRVMRWSLLTIDGFLPDHDAVAPIFFERWEVAWSDLVGRWELEVPHCFT